MDLFEELIVEKGRLQNISKRLKDKELTESLERLSRNSIDMQGKMLSMRMISLELTFNRFPRMVRNTSKDLGKKIELKITGSETELDRIVVEELGDPLVHLIRNSIDHGIEMPEERKGKPEQGTIELKAYHKGNEAFIEIIDDGNGIPIEKIKEKILKNNLLNKQEVEMLNSEQVLQYIFDSGFSTAEKITDLSGRGVGLDVVKTKIESLGGTVKVTSKEEVGSKFTIKLPLTLSIIQALVIQQKKDKFIIPLSAISETIQINQKEISNIAGTNVLHYRNEILTMFHIDEIYGEKRDKNDYEVGLIIKTANKTYVLVIDGILGQQEIVLKTIEGLVENTPGIAGAAFLGDGSVSFVLDVNYFD